MRPSTHTVSKALACEPLLVKISGHSFNEANTLQRCVVFESEPKTLIAQKAASTYITYDLSE